MFGRTAKQSAAKSERRDTLSQLLASEDQMVSRLAGARGEADRILADAEEYARTVEGACEKTIADRIGAIRAETEQELEREFAQIKADTARDVSLLDDVDDGAVNELVALVLARLVATDDSSG